ncbi:ABC transporter permease [Bifidobacterium catulorum]|nr:ABC transporter permease [Bifidobacterium catulorum]
MQSNIRRYARYLLPLVAIAAVSCLMALMFYPMMNANMKNVPVAILSLDKGSEVQGKTTNIGDTLVDKMTSAASDSDDDPAIAWHEVHSRDDIDRGFDNHEYYAAIVIPKDFTAKQVAVKQTEAKKSMESATALAQAMMTAQTQAQMQARQKGLTGEAAQKAVQAAVQKAMQQAAAQQSGATSDSASSASVAPTIELTVDNAKSPMLANLLKQSLPAMLGKTGATVKTTTLHEGDVATNSSLPTAAMMGQNVLIMPTYLMSLIVSLLCAMQFARTSYDSRTQRWATFGMQLGAALVWSLGVALGADCIFAMLGSGWLSGSMVVFLWFASFALMSVLLGLMNIGRPLGILCGVLGMGLGMTSGLFPSELLPAFWHDWIYGWVPQRFIGEGVRAVLYGGEGWWNAGSEPMLVILCVGLAVFVLAGLMPLGRHKAREAAE